MYTITVKENESGEFDGYKFSRIAADAVAKLTQNPSAQTVPAGTYTLDDEDAARFCVAGRNGTLQFE